MARADETCRVVIISSFRVHFGDVRMLATERSVSARFRGTVGGRAFVLRPGHLLADAGDELWTVRVFASLYPLVPARFQSCFVDSNELFVSLDAILDTRPLRTRSAHTVLGTNRPVRDVFAERASRNMGARCMTTLARGLAFLLVGHAIGFLVSLVARCYRPLSQWQCNTLEPATVDELLSLCSPLNARYVAVAGYNTGVTHFGWRYAGKTVIKTTGCANRVRVGDRIVDVDAGTTLKRVRAELDRRGRELYVMPNYSYISMGTTFFVPVHGSGSEVSTLGDTIEKVLLYDPRDDRLHVVRRGDPRFVQAMYNPRSGVLALRLRLRVRSQTRYYVRESSLESPSADEVWATFEDPTPSNIELRKARASATAVQVTKYYKSPSASDAEATLEVPRDSIGRIWDRLEENRLTSWLFHMLVRRFGFHVELFLDRQEFEVFWRAHTALPLKKTQLRFVRRDDLPHSPVNDRDCISADLFMKRSESVAFLRFVKEHLPHVRHNPGKHSM